MITTTREHAPASRYIYDSGLCSYANGWCQIDTPSDASYFGVWLHPQKKLIFSYVEGDCTLQQCETNEELVMLLREIEQFHLKNAGKPARIDPGLNPEMVNTIYQLGVADLLHNTRPLN